MSDAAGMMNRSPSSSSSSISWKWIWPRQGATPLSQGLDSEMFDRDDYPYSETFVREAIQNTLDARLDPSRPVTISFRFHRAALAHRRAFLEGAIAHRAAANLAIPEEWSAGTIDWLTIEDFNAKGLAGDLKGRMSDFWNYWLNFNVSNKDGSGRGGRGIGRVTFLIASRVQAVIGMTRRISDNRRAACGMCVLKAVVEPEGLRSTHAYLASAESSSIYQLHDSVGFYSDLRLAFDLDGYDNGTGLALVIPYPHEELTAEGILASAIEHFAPALLAGSLVVRVDDDVLDNTTIDDVAESVSHLIHSKPIAEDVGRYLALIRAGMAPSVTEIEVPTLGKGLIQLRDNPTVKKLQVSSEKGQTVALRISFPMIRNGRAEKVSLKAVLARTPTAKSPIDRFFREGMSLPDLKARNPGELDLVAMVEDVALARYLNLCEGKAHLDISQSKEIKTKLEENGFVPPYPVKNFVKSLPAELRSLLTPDITAPDSSVFDAFFSLPDDAPGKDPRKRDRLDEPPPPPPPPPPPRISPLAVETLENGFRVKANPKFSDWPVNVLLRIAYADGSRKPAWSELDFRPTDLKSEAADCEFEFLKNKIQAKNCGPNCLIEVTGFDTNLELDTQIRFWKNAQTD